MNLPKVFYIGFAAMAFSGWIATLAGWYATEIGRQPWLVHGVLLTRDAVGPVSGGAVFATLMMYVAIYTLLLIAYLVTVFYLNNKACKSDVEDRTKIKEGAGAIIHAKERIAGAT